MRNFRRDWRFIIFGSGTGRLEASIGSGWPATRAIRITEHYIRMDYAGEGKARLYRVTTGGDGSRPLQLLARM